MLTPFGAPNCESGAKVLRVFRGVAIEVHEPFGVRRPVRSEYQMPRFTCHERPLLRLQIEDIDGVHAGVVERLASRDMTGEPLSIGAQFICVMKPASRFGQFDGIAAIEILDKGSLFSIDDRRLDDTLL